MSVAIVAQVWRGGEHNQVPIAFLLRRVKVVDLTYPVARLLGVTGTSDPIDADVVFLARDYGWRC
jgi:hypothetical protein